MQNEWKQGGVPHSDAVAEINPSGTSRIVLACEHATNAIPAELHHLGLGAETLQSHIAWDIGALAVAEAMAAELDAALVAHRVSRLVYDCNRTPGAPDAIAEISEYQEIPANTGLSATARAARVALYYTPFCDALSAALRARAAASPVLVTVHSFTPVYKGERRTVEVGILHDTDSRLADEMLQCAEADGDMAVQRNSPYGADDGVTFTLAHHAVRHGYMNVMIEIRNDLIADAAGQKMMATRLSQYVNKALAALGHPADLAQVL